MKGRKKRKNINSDRKINKKNKSLMIDKILSYSPSIREGIEAYKEANRDFLLLIFLSTVLIDFPLISLPCCILSMFFCIKMLKFIRYKSINNIVIELAKDLSFKGIYDKEKLEGRIEEFELKYGTEVHEYEELMIILDKYDAFVTKIECVLNSIQENRNIYNENISLKNQGYNESGIICEKMDEKQYSGRQISSYYKKGNNNLSVFYEKEDGKIKKVNKAIEFFEDDDKMFDDSKTVILKNTNENSKNITIYLYKKSSNLQKSAL